jgi:hypothetical protein
MKITAGTTIPLYLLYGEILSGVCTLHMPALYTTTRTVQGPVVRSPFSLNGG